jgi:hypothetical protein
MWDAAKSGIPSRDANSALKPLINRLSNKISEPKFQREVRTWALNPSSWDHIRADGKKVIETDAGEVFLSTLLSDALGVSALPTVLPAQNEAVRDELLDI